MSDRQINISQIDGAPSGSTPVVLGSPAVPIDDIYLNKLNGSPVAGLFSQTGITDRLNIANLMFRMANYDYQNKVDQLELIGGQLNIFKDIDDIVDTNNVIVKTLNEGHPNGVAELIPSFSQNTIGLDNIGVKLTEQIEFNGIETTIYGFTFNNDGTKLITIGSKSLIRQFSLSTPYDINTITEDDVTYPESSIYDLHWSNDGTKLYACHSSQLIEYTTTTPYDIIDIIENGRYDLPISSMFSMAWSIDGTKLTISRSTGTLYYFTLSTPFDITTISYTGLTYNSGVSEVRWNNDGTKLFGLNNTIISSFNVSTPYTIEGINLNNTIKIDTSSSFNFNGNGSKIITLSSPMVFREITLPSPYTITNVNLKEGKSGVRDKISTSGFETLEWSEDGNYLYVGVNGVDDILQYESKTPFSLQGLSYTGRAFYYTFSNMTDFFITKNGEYLYVLEGTTSTGYVSVFKFATPYMVDTLTSRSSRLTLNASSNYTWSTINVNEDGSKMYVFEKESRNQLVYEMGTNHDMTTAVLSETYTNTYSTTNVTNGFRFTKNGEYLFVNNSSGTIYIVKMTTPFDVRSVSDVKTFSSGFSGSNIENIAIHENGLGMSLINSDTNDIINYTLPKLFRPNNFIQDRVYYGLTGFDTYPTAVRWSPDGTNLYLIGSSTDTLNRYIATTPYEISGLTKTNDTYSFSSQSGDMKDFQWSPDGLMLFALENRNIFMYNAGVAFDINTLEYSNESYSVAYNIESFNFSPDGLRLFIHNSTNDRIEQFSNSVAYSLVGLSLDNTLTIPFDSTITSMSWKSDGTKLFLLGSQNRRLYEMTTNNPYSIVGMSYTNKFFELFSYGSNPGCVEWAPSGDKFLYLDSTGATLFDIETELNWSIATIQYNNISRSISTEEPNVFNIEWSPDGSRFWMIGTNGDNIRQFTVGTPFSINTISQHRLFSVSSQEANPNGFTWSNDGAKLYVVGSSSDRIHQYSASTPFEINGLTYDNISIPVNGQDSNPYSLQMSIDGTKMFMLGVTTDTIYRYDLVVPYDISGMTYSDVNYYVGNFETSPTSFKFSTDGNKFFIGGSSQDTIFEFEMNAPFEITTAKHNNNIYKYEVGGGNMRGIAFSNTGHKMYVADYGSDTIYEFDLPGLFTLTRMVNTKKTFTIGQLLTPMGVDWNNDGTKLFAVGTTTDSIHEFATAIPYSVSGMTYIQNSVSLSHQMSSPADIKWSNDGLSVFILDSSLDTIFEYQTLSPYNLSSLSNTGRLFSVSSYESSPQAFSFNNDGTKLYFLGTSTDVLHQCQLPIPFNLGTVNYEKSSIVVTSNPYGFTWNGDGSKLFVTDSNWIYEYQVTTPYDVGELINPSGDKILPPDNSLRDLFFNNDGSKLFSISNSNKRINEYSLTNPYDLEYVHIESEYKYNQLPSADANGIEWSADGLKLYAVYDESKIYEYITQEPFNVSGLTYHAVGNLNENAESCRWSSDGSKLFTLSSYTSSTQYLNVFDASTPYDVTSLIQDNSVRPSITNYLRDFIISPDGNDFVFLRQYSSVNDVRVYQTTVPYDLDNFSLINVNTLSDMTSPTAISWGNDGNSLFVSDTSLNMIFEYELASQYVLNGLSYNGKRYVTDGIISITPSSGYTEITLLHSDSTYNVETVILNGSKGLDSAISTNSVSLVQDPVSDSDFEKIVWSYDGTKVYFSDELGDKIYQYNAQTPFSLINLSFFSDFALSQNIRRFFITPDGKYLIGVVNNTIYTYEFQINYDITTLVYVGSHSLGTLISSSIISAIDFSDNGLRMMIIYNNVVRVFSLSKAYDVTTNDVGLMGSFTGTSTIQDAFISNDGTYCIVSDISQIYKIKFIEPYNPECALNTSENLRLPSAFGIGVGSISKHPSEEIIYVSNRNDGYSKIILNNNMQLNAIENTTGVNFSSQDNTMSSPLWVNDGLVFYAAGGENNKIYEYRTLSEFNINNLTYENVSYDVNTNPKSLAFNNDGTKFYYYSAGNNGFYEFNTQQQFRVSGMTLNDNIPINSGSSVRWGNGGQNLFVVYSSIVEKYDVDTPYSISGVTLSEKFDTKSDRSLSISDIIWSPDGSKMFLSSGDYIHQFSTLSPYGFVGMVYDKIILSLEGTVNDSNILNMSLSPDGSKLYVFTNNDVLGEYLIDNNSIVNYNSGTITTHIDITNDMVNPPSTVLISTLTNTPSDSNIQFRIQDITGTGSEVIVTQSDFEKEVGVLSLNTKQFKVTIELNPSTDGTKSPVLDDYSIYFQ